MAWWFLLLLLIFGSPLAAMLSSDAGPSAAWLMGVLPNGPGFNVVSAIWLLSLPAALWVLLQPARRPSVLYVRAFRSDLNAAHLRLLLRAALGSRYRLCGIRAPGVRVSWLFRVFLTAYTGVRYLGSGFSELEAGDDNWMARLLASCARTRLVFVDVRDITPHVADEIVLSFCAMGLQRCIFLSDPSKAENEWRQLIATTIGDDSIAAKIRLLCYRGESLAEEESFVRRARELINATPQGFPSVVKALSFVCSHVPREKWPTPFWEKDSGQFVIGLVGWIALNLGLEFLPKNEATSFFIAPLAVIAVGVFYVAVLARAWQQSAFAARFKHITGNRDPRWRVLGATSLVLLWVACLPLLFVMVRSQLTAWADSKHCETSLRAMGSAVRDWSLGHGDRYFFNVSTNQGGTRELRSPDAEGFEINPVDHFRALSGLVESPVFWCRADAKKSATTNFANLGPMNVSYRLRCGPDADQTRPDGIIVICPIHGHVLRADGSVEEGAPESGTSHDQSRTTARGSSRYR
jgi:hypothetical protein